MLSLCYLIPMGDYRCTGTVRWLRACVTHYRYLLYSTVYLRRLIFPLSTTKVIVYVLSRANGHTHTHTLDESRITKLTDFLFRKTNLHEWFLQLCSPTIKYTMIQYRTSFLLPNRERERFIPTLDITTCHPKIIISGLIKYTVGELPLPPGRLSCHRKNPAGVNTLK